MERYRTLRWSPPHSSRPAFPTCCFTSCLSFWKVAHSASKACLLLVPRRKLRAPGARFLGPSIFFREEQGPLSQILELLLQHYKEKPMKSEISKKIFFGILLLTVRNKWKIKILYIFLHPFSKWMILQLEPSFSTRV